MLIKCTERGVGDTTKFNPSISIMITYSLPRTPPQLGVTMTKGIPGSFIFSQLFCLLNHPSPFSLPFPYIFSHWFIPHIKKDSLLGGTYYFSVHHQQDPYLKLLFHYCNHKAKSHTTFKMEWIPYEGIATWILRQNYQEWGNHHLENTKVHKNDHDMKTP